MMRSKPARGLVRPVFTGLAIGLALSSPAIAADRPIVTAQPPSQDVEVARYVVDPAKEPALSKEDLVKLLRQHVKYVFVLFNENESFDHEYGTFPGANGLYSTGDAPRAAADTPGLRRALRRQRHRRDGDREAVSGSARRRTPPPSTASITAMSRWRRSSTWSTASR